MSSVARSTDFRDERRHTISPVANPNDARSMAEKDRDRLLYSSSLRRLAHITQVIAADVGHVFHNRLTHSLQVAQVGRSLARRLRQRVSQAMLDESEGLDPDVVEAACLAHDLGHPPFGHIAEQELNSLAGPEIDGFEGNAQSFRIITKLAQHSPEHRGLDLTRATLAAVLKYPWLHGENPDKLDKWGAYRSEERDFGFAMELAREPGTKTLEADLMDWADDITYSVHDVEDFYRAGRVPVHLLADRRYDKERVRFFEAVAARHPDAKGLPTDHKTLQEAFTRLITGLFPLDRPYTGRWRERAALRDFTSQLIDRFVGASELQVHNGRCVLKKEANAELEVTMLKELTWVYVIEAPGLATQQAGLRHIIRTLFKRYWLAVEEEEWHLFPPYFHEALRDATRDTNTQRRIVIDMIASMTEVQATAVFHRLIGTASGSGMDQII
jgi:dGTPase